MREVIHAIIIAILVFIMVAIGANQLAEDAHATPPGWHLNRVASWYSMPGNTTSCGSHMTASSWWVAALQYENMRCDMRVLICHEGRCVRVRVRDRGADRNDRRDWDLTPRVKRALRCSDLCTHINWRKRHPGEPAW